MADGCKTGGRKKGTPNKRTQELAAKMEALGCDPIEGMATIALDMENPPELRGRMFSELAQYLFPKRKALEHSGEIGRAYVAQMPQPIDTSEEWQKQYAPTIQ